MNEVLQWYHCLPLHFTRLMVGRVVLLPARVIQGHIVLLPPKLIVWSKCCGGLLHVADKVTLITFPGRVPCELRWLSWQISNLHHTASQLSWDWEAPHLSHPSTLCRRPQLWSSMCTHNFFPANECHHFCLVLFPDCRKPEQYNPSTDGLWVMTW